MNFIILWLVFGFIAGLLQIIDTYQKCDKYGDITVGILMYYILILLFDTLLGFASFTGVFICKISDIVIIKRKK